MDKVQTATHCVTRAAEHGGPMIFAQMGMLQAIHRHHQRVFNPDRKDLALRLQQDFADRIYGTAALRQPRSFQSRP
jgi:hypothetical protein